MRADSASFPCKGRAGARRSKATEAAVLEKIRPHLRKAVQLRSHLDQRKMQRDTLEDVLDGLPTGVVLIGDRGEVVFANASARRIDRAQDGLTIAGNRLRAASSAGDRALQEQITGAIDPARLVDRAGGAVIAVQRPSGARPYALLVTPGPGADSQSPYRNASAVVLIGDADPGLASSEQLVAQLYGLTASEARLACAIASGESLDGYAGKQGIAVSTARWTMKQVLAKTGARRQADCVRLLLTGPAAAR
jgi:DNA-binding CsgD family transcriptional regulator